MGLYEHLDLKYMVMLIRDYNRAKRIKNARASASVYWIHNIVSEYSSGSFFKLFLNYKIPEIPMQRNDGRGFRAIALAALLILLLGAQPLVKPAKAASDGWAVGREGGPHDLMIFRWDGSGWSSYFSPTSNVLWSVDMVSGIDGWAVGEYGTIIRWDGSSWSVEASAGNILWSVDMVSASDGWAVGDDGTIVHWDGSRWSTVTSPTINILHSVDMVSAIDGWAVGWGGTIIRWDGSSWSLETSPIDDTLHSVDMVSPNDGWAVGEYGTIIRWNGSSWSTVTSPTGEVLRCVDMVSPSEGWAIVKDFNFLIRWDGSSWSLETSPSYSLNSVDMAGEADGYVLEDLAARVAALEARVKAVEHRSLALVARAPNDKIYYRTYTDGSWGVWRQIPGKTIDSPVATVIDNQLHIAMIAPNGRLYHSWVDISTYTFSGWTNIWGSFPSHPALTFLP
jgi:hypothetical protein